MLCTFKVVKPYWTALMGRNGEGLASDPALSGGSAGPDVNASLLVKSVWVT